MSYLNNKPAIDGTIMFDGHMARLGYNLNKMCYSLNDKAARAEFANDEMAYCDKFGLSKKQKEAIRCRDIIGLLELGGSIYFLAKFAGGLGLNMQDIGAIQTGVTVEEFREKLVKAGK